MTNIFNDRKHKLPFWIRWWLLFNVRSVLLPPGQPFRCHTAASSWRRPGCQTQGGQNSKHTSAEQHKHWLNTQKRNVFYRNEKRREYYSRTTKLELLTTNILLSIKISPIFHSAVAFTGDFALVNNVCWNVFCSAFRSFSLLFCLLVSEACLQ